MAMLPGPIEDSAAPSPKNMIGMVPRLPRHTRTAWWAIRSSVPFVSASANSRVTPVSVRNSWLGKPFMIVATGIPPM